LVDHLLKKICQQKKKEVKGLTPAAIQKLVLHDWPGNVRELENTLEYAVTMTEQDVITEDLVLQAKVETNLAAEDSGIQTRLLPTPESLKTLKEARADFEKAYLIHLMNFLQGRLARQLEIGKYRADLRPAQKQYISLMISRKPIKCWRKNLHQSENCKALRQLERKIQKISESYSVKLVQGLRIGA
jgi:two-component system response regulator GlrR